LAISNRVVWPVVQEKGKGFKKDCGQNKPHSS
jgi:hypothetical protein